MLLNWLVADSGNGLSPLSITWTNADALSNGPLATNFKGFLIKILIQENEF